MEKKRITTLFLIVLADMAGASAILPIIPVYVLGQFHATPFQAALVIPEGLPPLLLAPAATAFKPRNNTATRSRGVVIKEAPFV